METSTSSEDFPFLARLEILPKWEAAARRWLEVGGAGDYGIAALALSTPLAPEAAAFVRFVKLGKLRLNLEGEELRHV
jgi:hypothetical protein